MEAIHVKNLKRKFKIILLSTLDLGLLMGYLSLITRNVVLLNNTVYFLLLLFSGANVALETLPEWMQSISRLLPLTRGIESARDLIGEAGLSDVMNILYVEILSEMIFILPGYFLFRFIESQAKKMRTLEIF